MSIMKELVANVVLLWHILNDTINLITQNSNS